MNQRLAIQAIPGTWTHVNVSARFKSVQMRENPLISTNAHARVSPENVVKISVLRMMFAIASVTSENAPNQIIS